MRPENQSDSQEESNRQRSGSNQVNQRQYYWHPDVQLSCSMEYNRRDYEEDQEYSHITYEHQSDYSQDDYDINTEDLQNQLNYWNSQMDTVVSLSSHVYFEDGVNYTVNQYLERRQFRGIKPQDISQIPKMIWGSHNLQLNSQQKCGICLTHYELNQSLRVLGCLHRFHQRCVDTWLGGNRTCPTCRRVVEVPQN